MANDDNERTEEATQTRRDEFRKRGQVAHTRELATCFTLLASAGLVLISGKFFNSYFTEIFEFNFGPEMVKVIKTGSILSAFSFTFQKGLTMLAPVLGAALFIGVASSYVQIGFLQVEDALSPDLSRINPLDGLNRIFSFRALIEIFKALLKLTVVAAVLYFLFSGEVKKLPQIMTFSLEEVFVYIGRIGFKLFAAMGGMVLVIALTDYFLQYWNLERKMRMSKQEIKEEMKQREGDPLIKARVRRIQKEVANRRMMDAIPKATVVITNPTHIAVVLRYDDQLPAPVLVAKGADFLAEKIRNKAREHGLPIIENKPLARTIYKTMKLGQIIPKDLYIAVAEVLSYIYKLKNKLRKE